MQKRIERGLAGEKLPGYYPLGKSPVADLVDRLQRCDLDNLVCRWRFPERKQVVMKTKGALIWEFNQPWSIEEIEIGDPVKDEVKIQMEAAGMCHSDHHLVTGGIPMGGFPVLGGHEGAGIVTEVGPGVEDIATGDHVVLSFIPSCGHCPSCQAGLRNLCDLGAGLLNGAAVSDGTFRIQAKGQNVFPMTLLGTFSPYMVVHKSSVVKIDPSIPFEVACLVGCGVTTGYGSAVRTADIRPGQDVAIVGVGGVGMSALQGAVNAGARHIFVIEPVEWKRRCGAEIRCHPRVSGHQRRADGHRGGHRRLHGPQGGRHRRRAQGRGHRQLHDDHRQGRHLRC